MKFHDVLGQGGPVRRFLQLERRRLDVGVAAEEVVQGVEVDSYRAVAEGNAAAAFERIMQLMRLVNTKGLEGEWPSTEEWHALLPDWFTKRCDPDKSEEEFERELALPYQDRWELWRSQRYSVQGWSLAMAPDDREWLWWDAKIKDADTVVVGIDRLSDALPEYPAEFIWMFETAGFDVFSTMPDYLDEHLLLMPGEERD